MILGNCSCSIIGTILGMPGHSEKKAIGVFFDRKRTKIQRPTYRKEWQDLIDFEGNANGFFSTCKPTRDRRTSYCMLLLVLYEISKEFT
jgi:hypothetical protein